MLIGINVAVWVAILVTGGAGSRLVDLPRRCGPTALCRLGHGGFDVSRRRCAPRSGGEWLPGVADGAYWQV